MLSSLLIVLASAIPQAVIPQGKVQVLDPAWHHLGDDATPDWKEASAEPEGTALHLAFMTTSNATEVVLSLRHLHVDNWWWLSVNGKRISRLQRTAAWQEEFFALPPGTLVDGQNEISVEPENPRDDILIGDLRLLRSTLREHLNLRALEVLVKDDSGERVPVKLTIADMEGRLPEIFYAATPRTAVRPGIVYTADGWAHLEVPAGNYTLYASKGVEWGVAQASVDLSGADLVRIEFEISREVDTRGYIASDTHIHTYTFSGHGDASVEERMITLAAEGVEFAVATDHNHNTDYRSMQSSMALSDAFTVVTGNEVTTEVGHVNAFPLDPDDEVPDYQVQDWVKLVQGIRGKGATVVILNHPRWPKILTGPFGEFGLHPQTGEFADGRAFPFDAIEVINATALQPDPLLLFQDWFALLNHGDRVMAVGSSDSHTVGDPVGQGRTYIVSSTDEPGSIDINQACRSFIEGTTSISLGMFCETSVQGKKMGQMVSLSERRMQVQFRVAAPSWVTPREALVYLDGALVARQVIPTTPGRPTDLWLEFDLRTPSHDVYLVCVALGDGISAPFWPTSGNYTLAASNPIWIDVDGDGRYQAPREVAAAILLIEGTEITALTRAMREVDDAVAVSLLALARCAFEERDLGHPVKARARLVQLAGGAIPRREAFEIYLASLPPVAVPLEPLHRKTRGKH